MWFVELDGGDARLKSSIAMYFLKQRATEGFAITLVDTENSIDPKVLKRLGLHVKKK